MSAISNQHILVSRIDAIGDVVLTLPLCGYLKSNYPDAKISFLGRTYTEAIIKTCGSVDRFLNYDEIKALTKEDQVNFLRAEEIDTIIHVYPQKQIAILAKVAGIKNRIGTINRAYHWFTCNRLVRLSRKKSELHEAQLNIILLRPLGIKKVPAVNKLPAFYNFSSTTTVPEAIKHLLNTNRFNIILHPKSHGSGREWSLERFKELIDILPANQYNIFISGSDKEQAALKHWLPTLPKSVHDITGLLTLGQFITFIASANGLVASGTGPLHIAAASGIYTLGLFPAIRPINASRWGPVGRRAEFIESTGDNLPEITAGTVYNKIKAWSK